VVGGLLSSTLLTLLLLPKVFERFARADAAPPRPGARARVRRWIGRKMP